MSSEATPPTTIIRRRIIKTTAPSVAPATEPAPAPAAAPTILRRRRITTAAPPPPTAPLEELSDEQRAEQLKRFYKAYAKNPKDNYYNSEGNLFLKGTKGTPDTTILLRGFRPLTEEEIQEMEEKRGQAIEEAETAYETARKDLRTALESFKAGVGSIENYLSKNQAVTDLERQRRKAAYPERYIREEGKPDIRRILLQDPYEQRKMPYPVRSVQRSEFEYSKAAGAYLAPGQRVPTGVVMEVGAAESLILSDEEGSPTRFFHPSFQKEFVLEGTRFASPHQAFEYLRLQRLGNQELAQTLLGTRSSYTISHTAKQDERPIPHARELWIDILTKFYASSPELLEKLKETGNQFFVLHTEKEPFWAHYTLALDTVRNHFLESNQTPVATEDEQVDQSVITTQEQKNAKVGAIVNARRFHH